ncbi:hypothetical protein RJ035_001939 [Blastomyces gilchristii]
MASPNNNNNKDNNNNDNGYDPRNYGPGPSPVDQSIPLQDLSRPPDIATAGVPDRRRRRTSSSSSTAGREGFPVRRTSIIGRRGIGRRYERIAEDSPSPRERSGMDTFHTVNLSSDHLHHNSPISLADGGQEFSAGAHHSFQEAIGSVGLSFDGPATIHFSGRDSGPQRSYQAHVRHSDDSTPFPYMGSQTPIDEENYMSPIDTNENDTTPLTDRRYQQPIDGASISHGQRHDRPSVHFASERTAVGPHLVDDLPHSEEGNSRMRSGSGGRNRPGRRSRQLAPAPNSALSRAGSMMRMMSQRVVNISNEPEIVDQTLRHKSSLKQARLEAPPSLPAMTEYAHDISTPGLDDGYPPEKRPSLFSKLRDPDAYQTEENPLKGNSLGIFSPNSKLRRGLLEILIHPAVEPIILILIIIQTILLAIESSVYKGERGSRWGTPAFDYAFLVLFLIYTLEISARIIVSGLMFNADEYSTLDRSLGLRKALVAKGKDLLMPQRGLSTRKSGNPTEPQISVLRSFTGAQNTADRSGHSSSLQRYRLARRAFFRHSFTRIDFLAVVSYWISFVLSNLSLESQHHLYVFRMLSCLRILRLLGLTSGTSVIFRSLKKAAPLLVHVAFLISFFWLLFAIVGVQSFKSSMRRTCVWVDPENQSNFTLNAAPDNVQFCGGYRELGTGASKPWVLPDGTAGAAAPKGYLCPEGSLCVQGSNPYGGTISFDDVAHSLQLVFVVMSSNTFTDILYYMTDTDYLAAALFFVFGFIVLSLWLVNLLVAVITSSFQVIREESKRSAFTSEHIDEREFEDDTPRKLRGLKLLYDRTYWLWIAVITFGLVVQGLRSSSMGPHRRKLIDRTEILVTIILAAEIFLRFASDWRNFFKGARNWVDLALAIITCIIIIPPIRYSGRTYAALSIFQVLRIYRIVLAFSVMSDLIKTVFKNVVGLLNLIIFVFLITFLASIFAVQLFRGQIPSEDIGGNEIQITFFDIYNSFLGMYQILSSENWTAILYSAVESTYPWNTAWISAIFVIMWFILANFVVLNMFIAVIQESFDVSEDEKRIQQVKAFLQQKQLSGSSQGNLSLSTIFRLGRNSRFRDPLDHGPAALEMLLKDAVVNEFLDEQPRSPPADIQPTEIQPGHPEHKNGVTNFFSSFKNRIMNREPNPFYSKLKFSKVYDDSDPTAMAKEVLSASEQRKRAQRQYLQKYPNYNVSLYIFKPTNPLRRFCQRIVGPGRGSSRIEGIDPYKPVWYTFSAFIYAAIVAMVLLACIATPLYQRNYLQTHKPGLSNWFVWTDLAFAIIFTIEAVIKVIADGFFWTPNAYFRGSWGFIDGIVLITLWINVVSAIFNATATSRVVGAFKALRALRLLNVSDSARETFHAVIILGGWKVISSNGLGSNYANIYDKYPPPSDPLTRIAVKSNRGVTKLRSKSMDAGQGLLLDFCYAIYFSWFLSSILNLSGGTELELDQLFKTAAASLTAIGNLLATWFVLFLVYAIALTQIFGLTKFGEGETGSINFRDVPRALILLFRTSVGEGWNEVMEDFATMVPPYCTADGQFFESDCGSAGWARTLFISWNIVSMYIFVSLFVSLIFESFSYVYQRSSGLYAISREEIRRFKQAWATYDPDGTGYISKEAFPRLLGELSGIFEMRIYDGDFTVGRIVEDCKVHRRESNQAPYVRAVDGIDLDKLRRRIDRIPVQQIRRKRARMNAFYEEVLVSADPEKGISFTSCLMILAHYNVITDSKSLRLEEFLRRRARLQRVEEAVRRSVVIGFFDTLYWSRKFRRRFEPHHDSRLVSVPQFAVPEIFVEDGEHEEQLQQQQQEQQQEQQQQRQRSHSQLSDPTFPSPMLSPDARSRSSGGSDGRGHMRSPPSIDTNVSPMLRGTGSPTRGNEWVSRSPSLSPRQSRALYGSTPPSPDDITNHRPDDSSVSVQGVMESLDNSAWGESIRRSFTMRRPQGRE